MERATTSKAFIGADEEASLFLKSETAGLKLDAGVLWGVKQVSLWSLGTEES